MPFRVSISTEVLQSLKSSSLQCSICWDVLDDCVSTECLHRYCRSCIEKTFQDYASKSWKEEHLCPLCNLKLTSKRALKQDSNINGLRGVLFPSKIEMKTKKEADEELSLDMKNAAELDRVRVDAMVKRQNEKRPREEFLIEKNVTRKRYNTGAVNLNLTQDRRQRTVERKRTGTSGTSSTYAFSSSSQTYASPSSIFSAQPSKAASSKERFEYINFDCLYNSFGEKSASMIVKKNPIGFTLVRHPNEKSLDALQNNHIVVPPETTIKQLRNFIYDKCSANIASNAIKDVALVAVVTETSADNVESYKLYELENENRTALQLNHWYKTKSMNESPVVILYSSL